MGFLGTDVSDSDAEIILTSLVKAYSVVPDGLKEYVPKLEDVLEAIPDEARKYSLEDLIKILSWAAKNEIVV